VTNIDIIEIAKLELRDGDILVIRGASVSREALDEIQDYLGFKVMVMELPDDASLEVVGPEEE
jgi:hypothetical protein